MVDFRRLMTDEQREKWDRYREFEAEQKRKYAAMDNNNLIASAQHCMSQMSGPHEHGPGTPVYDAAFFHAIVPELFNRIREPAAEEPEPSCSTCGDDPQVYCEECGKEQP